MNNGILRTPLGANSSKAKITVIGVGNEFRKDDGLGPFIVRELRAKDLTRGAVDFKYAHGLSVIELWKDADAAIIFDAVRSEATPGTIYRFEVHKEAIPNQLFNYSTHNLNVGQAIELGKVLKLLPSFLILYGIEGKCFDYGSSLSLEVKKAAGQVVETAIKDITGLVKKLGVPQFSAV